MLMTYQSNSEAEIEKQQTGKSAKAVEQHENGEKIVPCAISKFNCVEPKQKEILQGKVKEY